MLLIVKKVIYHTKLLSVLTVLKKSVLTIHGDYSDCSVKKKNLLKVQCKQSYLMRSSEVNNKHPYNLNKLTQDKGLVFTFPVISLIVTGGEQCMCT